MAKEQIITGIDIGSSKIATVIATLSPESKISVIGVSTVKSRGMKKGVVVDIDEAVEAIAESLEAAERMAGYAVSSAFVLVDGTHINSLNSHGVVAVSNPEGEIGSSDVDRVTEAAQAISIPSSREIIHVIPRGFIVDSQDGVRDPVGMSGIRLEVRTNIISGSTTVMRNLVKCVQQVGVDVDDLVYGGLAASESTLTDTEKELGAVLVDIGGGTTDVLIFEGGSPAYAAVLPIGGQNVTNDLAIGLRTSLEDAEKIKLKLSNEKRAHEARGPSNLEHQEGGLAEDGSVGDDEVDVSDLGLEVTTLPKTMLYDIIEARLNEIFSLVALEIKKSNLTGKLPAGVVVCGGSSQTIGVSKVAKRVLNMPVRLGLPAGVTGLIEEISGPAYAASVGLLLYGSEQGGGRRVGIASARTRIVEASSALVNWIKSFIP
jgi:cell division protein FtsA